MRLLAVVLLAGFTPIILLTMLLVRLTSKGPALLHQTRLGKDGKRFQVVKIRTMYCNAEELSGPTLCQPGDSRITPIGRILRFLHIDELPQLVNVVRGEMCLVGPRPERPEIVARNRLEERVPGFSERLKVLPGVTGLAQINLPADQTPDCVIPKVQLDLEYIATANASLDTRILVCTALRMLGLRHGRGVKLLRVDRKVARSGNGTPLSHAPRLPERIPAGELCSAGITTASLAVASENGASTSFSDLVPPWEELCDDGLEIGTDDPTDLAPIHNRPR